MINPDEYNEILINVRLSHAEFINDYCNKVDYGIQRHKDKLTLLLLAVHLEVLEKARINPIDNDDKIINHIGQLPTTDNNVDYYYAKEYDDVVLLTALKNINHILKTGYVINIYPDVYKYL